jgi:hypothetical protein
MCRSIKRLANLDPPATEEEIRAAALQFVRKLSGASRPSLVNQLAFDRAVDEVAAATEALLTSLQARVPPLTREGDARKAPDRAGASTRMEGHPTGEG